IVGNQTNSSQQAIDWFQAEHLSLAMINQRAPGFAPQPLAYGLLGSAGQDGAFLIAEFVRMRGARTAETQRELARRLAQLYQPLTEDTVVEPWTAASDAPPLDVAPRGRFGFACTTFCGSTAQPNTWFSGDWPTFWRQQRLQPMLDQLQHDKQIQQLGMRLLDVTPEILSNVQPTAPSLLHGDLWSGNWGVREDTGKPIIFDPAAYFGHHEADLGIMKMFGGFTADFYTEYERHFPTDKQRGRRVDMYELYHHLNHYVIFGQSYRNSSLQLMQSLL
ncbi:Fructosamine/Ketosamine-3-kinase, partial [Thamnocephalis sphaerospora]